MGCQPGDPSSIPINDHSLFVKNGLNRLLQIYNNKSNKKTHIINKIFFCKFHTSQNYFFFDCPLRKMHKLTAAQAFIMRFRAYRIAEKPAMIAGVCDSTLPLEALFRGFLPIAKTIYMCSEQLPSNL